MQLTLRGFLLLFVTAPLMAAAVWAPGLNWIAALYLLLAIIFLVLDWRRADPISRFEIKREHDQKLSLGAENAIRLTVRNRSQMPAVFWLRDEPPDAFINEGYIFTGQAKGRQTWQHLYHVKPLRRGDYAFGNLTLRWLGPLGLVKRQGKVEAAQPIKVYPNLLEVRRYDLMLRRNRLQELGLRNTRQFGEGTEFERLREYLPDDDFRRINWKATARRNRPVTMEYQTERSQNIVAVMDTGRMMQSPVAQIAKLDYVVNAVLLLTYVATGMGDKVGLMTFADDIGHFLTPRQGRGQFYRMLELLYATEAQPVEPDYQRALTYLSKKQRKRALIVIFTDLSSGISMDALVGQLSFLSRRSLPLVVTISEPDIHAAAKQQPEDSLTVYQKAAAMQLLDERQIALDSLRRQGVHTLDVPANQLSLSVINRYVELKGRSLL